MVVFLRGENGDLLLRRYIAKGELHGKPVHLCLRQGIGAAKFHGVLGGDHEEEFGQMAAVAFHAHLAFAHGLEQGGLGAGRGAVDFIGQENVGEHGAFVELKLLLALVEDGDAENVRGQQVGGELHALEPGVDGFGQGLGQGGFAGAGKILEQHVAAGGEGREQLPGGGRLAAHDFGNVRGDVAAGLTGGFQ